MGDCPLKAVDWRSSKSTANPDFSLPAHSGSQGSRPLAWSLVHDGLLSFFGRGLIFAASSIANLRALSSLPCRNSAHSSPSIHPVRDLQPGYLAKVVIVSRHQRRSVGERDATDQQVDVHQHLFAGVEQYRGSASFLLGLRSLSPGVDLPKHVLSVSIVLDPPASPVPGWLHFLSFSAFGGGTASNMMTALIFPLTSGVRPCQYPTDRRS